MISCWVWRWRTLSWFDVRRARLWQTVIVAAVLMLVAAALLIAT